MSRYTAKLPNGRSIAWGYDNPLQEYFLTEYYSWKEIKELEKANANDDYEVPEVYFSIMSHTTTDPHPDHPNKMDWSNGEIVELMEKYGDAIPYKHKQAIGLDQPF